MKEFTENSGVRVEIGDEPTESDCFKAVFSDEAVAYMVIKTNRYAEQQIARLRNAGRLKEYSRACNWKETNITEMKAWIGLVLLMGHTRLPSYSSYWSTNFLAKQPVFGKIMTRDRFLSILKFLHLCNNNEDLPADHENHDCLHKIREFMERVLIPLWQGAYYPGKEVAVDETLVAFKGRTTLMQYKPKKPHKWGLNIWTLADQHGYVYNWDLYAGRIRGRGVENGLTYRVVTKLCRPIYDKGHHVFMDNYFSSPELFAELARNQTGACGTLRLNRRGVPEELKTAKPATGEIVTARDNDLLFICWTDKRQVNVLTSVHNSSTFRKRVRCK